MILELWVKFHKLQHDEIFLISDSQAILANARHFPEFSDTANDNYNCPDRVKTTE